MAYSHDKYRSAIKVRIAQCKLLRTQHKHGFPLATISLPICKPLMHQMVSHGMKLVVDSEH